MASVPLDRPAAPITDKDNSDLISRKNFRFKWGATEGLQIPPFTDFSPPSACGRAQASSRALRPARRMGTNGACAWGFLSAHGIDVPPWSGATLASHSRGRGTTKWWRGRLGSPSVTFRDTCLAAARSRSGSDNHSDCHSRPSRRFATP